MKITVSSIFLIAAFASISTGCKNSAAPSQEIQQEIQQEGQEENSISAQDIVSNAIAYYGGDNYEQAQMSFKFRDIEYTSLQDGGQFKLERIKYNDAIGKITDEVTNNGYRNVLNDEFAIDIADSMKVKFTNSVNSVHYFARLPYGLNAPAVKKELLGTDTINNVAYYEVKVTFNQDGGGVDFQDVFVYWFNTETYQMDYLAYSYETDGGGVRFRTAKNNREIGGIRFQDYTNYKPDSVAVVLQDLDKAYLAGALEEVSEILLEDVQVTLINQQ